ncbi:MAG: SdrD B-like domain-containing protein [Acidimicrobiales bacterium]
MVVDTNGDGTPDAQSLDADGDGIPDSVEAGSHPTNPVDSDGDGTPDYADLDSDGDGINDSVEAGNNPADPVDSDADGVPDYIDGDADNDGITDANEAGGDAANPTDTDDDGIPDYRDLDSDGDGVNDVIEGGNGRLDLDGDGDIDEFTDEDGDGLDDAATTTIVDTDNDGTPDAQSLDADGDGVLDATEVGTDPTHPRDTDGDGVPDYADVDADNDGILDAVEAGDDPADLVDSDGDGVPDYVDSDSDNDGIPDANEAGDDAAHPIDTDADGTPDYLDLDADGDGIYDIFEGGNGSLDADRDGVIDGLLDDDGDGLDDRGQIAIVDTDGDGVPDSRSLDSDGDGVSDAEESGGDPYADSDGDGIPNFIDPVGKTISGQVFWDLNRNGRIEANETDISNVRVWLMAAGPDGTLGTSDDVTLRTATTHSPYVFTDVPNGRFIVKVDRTTLPKGVYLTDDQDGAKDQLVTVEIDSADEMSINFGQNFALVTGIFRDAKGKPVSNAVVTFTDVEGHKFVVTTAADGSFTVEGSADNPLIVGNAVVRGVAADGSVVTQSVLVAEGGATTLTLKAPATAASSIPSALAFTGSTTSSIVILALGLVGAGFMLVGGTRRRRRTA